MRCAFLQRSFFCLLHIAASRNVVSFVSLPIARVKALCGQEERLRPNETFPIRHNLSLGLYRQLSRA